MPQINRVRIVNFNYNNGHRLIADEIFNFANQDGRITSYNVCYTKLLRFYRSGK